jgi:hypothetical protein
MKGLLRYDVTTTGCFQIFYSDYILKIPLGKLSMLSLEKNYSNYKLIKESPLHEFVNYHLCQISQFYKVEYLYTKVLTEEMALEIIDKFRMFYADNQYIGFPDFLFNESFILKKYEEIIKKLFEDYYFKTVPMHGDLTMANIMLNSKKEIVLIDLDRFTFEGIDKFDHIHLKIDEESKKKKISFFNYITNILNNKEYFLYNNYDLYMYFLVRVWIEGRVKLPEIYYLKTIMLNDLFIKKLFY